MKLLARVTKGKLELGDYNKKVFHDWLAKNEGAKVEINTILPESRNLRRWVEGGLIPLVTYFQDGMDYRSHEDNARVRDWLKIEFCSSYVVINDTPHKVGQSTKGRLKEFADAVLQWAEEQGYPTELLKPEDYRHWEDTIYSLGGPTHYLTYLESINKLSRPATPA